MGQWDIRSQRSRGALDVLWSSSWAFLPAQGSGASLPPAPIPSQPVPGPFWEAALASVCLHYLRRGATDLLLVFGVKSVLFDFKHL